MLRLLAILAMLVAFPALADNPSDDDNDIGNDPNAKTGAAPDGSGNGHPGKSGPGNS